MFYWFGSFTLKDKNRLNSIVKRCGKIAGVSLGELSVLYRPRATKKVKAISGDLRHPVHKEFRLVAAAQHRGAGQIDFKIHSFPPQLLWSTACFDQPKITLCTCVLFCVSLSSLLAAQQIAPHRDNSFLSLRKRLLFCLNLFWSMFQTRPASCLFLKKLLITSLDIV